MEEQENGKLSRRDAIGTTLLTSLAVAAGVFGISPIAAARSTGKKLKLDVNELKKKTKRKTGKTINPKHDRILRDYKETINKLKALKDQIFEIKESATGVLTPAISERLSRIEKKIQVRQEDAMAFFKNNVEVLLDQASNLLDRGLRDRSEWDALSVNLFNLGLEIGQFLDYDDIHKLETTAGFYDQAVNDRTTTLNIDKETGDKVAYLYELFNTMFGARWTDTEMQTIAGLHQQIAGLENAGGHGVDIAPLALTLEQYRLAIDYVYNVLQKEGLATTSDQSKMRIDNDTSKFNWETANRGFRMQRTEVERKYEYIKLLSVHAEDGILNYTKRLDPLKVRFQNDFNEAVLRITAAAKGMKEIFDYSVPLPVDDGKPDYFDNCIVWVRNAINFIIKFGRLDQSYVLPLSIRDLYFKADKSNAEANWEKAIKDGELKFQITQDNFPDKSFLRIKGISMFFQLNEANKHSCEYIQYYNGALAANIQPPKASFYLHDGVNVPTDQSFVPNLRLYRLATRNFIRTPEVGGTSLYANLSPFGEWSVELPQIKTNDITKLFKIEDITMDMYVTVHRSV